MMSSFVAFIHNILVCFVGSGYFSMWFPALFGLLFIGSVPAMIRLLMLWR